MEYKKTFNAARALFTGTVHEDRDMSTVNSHVLRSQASAAGFDLYEGHYTFVRVFVRLPTAVPLPEGQLLRIVFHKGGHCGINRTSDR